MFVLQDSTLNRHKFFSSDLYVAAVSIKSLFVLFNFSVIKVTDRLDKSLLFACPFGQMQHRDNRGSIALVISLKFVPCSNPSGAK